MKILGSDYDGTLTHKLGAETFEAIRVWRKKGHKFGMVSGRGVSFREELLSRHPELELDFFVGFNGGSIVDGEGNVIYERKDSTIAVRELISNLFAWGCPFVFFNGNFSVCVVERDSDKPAWVEVTDTIKPSELPEMNSYVQISVQLPDTDAAAAVASRIDMAYKGRVRPLLNGLCIDIVPPDVNKAEGLARIGEFFGCSREELIAVGDNINDLDMIGAFRSYAMESGVKAVRDLATFTTGTVAELIYRELIPDDM